MRDEHAALDMVGALTLQDSTLQQANMLQTLQTQQENLADQLKETYSQHLNLTPDQKIKKTFHQIINRQASQ